MEGLDRAGALKKKFMQTGNASMDMLGKGLRLLNTDLGIMRSHVVSIRKIRLSVTMEQEESLCANDGKILMKPFLRIWERSLPETFRLEEKTTTEIMSQEIADGKRELNNIIINVLIG